MDFVSLPGMQYRPAQMTAAAPGRLLNLQSLPRRDHRAGYTRQVQAARGSAAGDLDPGGRARIVAKEEERVPTPPTSKTQSVPQILLRPRNDDRVLAKRIIYHRRRNDERSAGNRT
jgi:hypothetical protein